jgi:hypothetical protein
VIDISSEREAIEESSPLRLLALRRQKYVSTVYRIRQAGLVIAVPLGRLGDDSLTYAYLLPIPAPADIHVKTPNDIHLHIPLRCGMRSSVA